MTKSVSHELLSDLKHDVEELKKKLTHPDAKAQELILEIESLKDSIHELTTIFQKSLEEVKEEDMAENMRKQIDAVISQNETIAKGMVAISDKLENFMHGHSPQPMVQARHSMGMAPPSGKVAPRPAMDSQELHLPPPPPRMEKKRGLFK